MDSITKPPTSVTIEYYNNTLCESVAVLQENDNSKVNKISDQNETEKLNSDLKNLNKKQNTNSFNKLLSSIPRNLKTYSKFIKISILVIFWILCSFVLMVKNVKIERGQQVSLSRDVNKGIIIDKLPKQSDLFVQLEGALLPTYYSNLSQNFMYIWIEVLGTVQPIHKNMQIRKSNVVFLKNISEIWRVPLVSDDLREIVPEVKQSYMFKLRNYESKDNLFYFTRINMQTNVETSLPLQLIYDLDPINVGNGVIYAAIVLIGLYVLIIFEIIHHTLAAMIACTLSIAILAGLNAKPTMQEIVSWVDIDTLLLLFAMMIIVTIFSETGIFDYTAVLAYELANGREWPVINALCFFTAVTSCFLDNVTTALLLTPTTIRLCEVMKMNPVPVLICMIIYSNIGGAITPIGDPPNVIIANNPAIVKSGVTFFTFTIHMFIGVFLASIVTYVYLKLYYRNTGDLHFHENECELELRRTIAVWERASACVGNYSRDEDSVQKCIKERTNALLGELKNKQTISRESDNCNYCNNLQELKTKYPIKNIPLLIKSGCVLLLIIILFCLHSLPILSHLGLGWTAMLGALLLLLLIDMDNTDIETVFSRVEWSTLLFFASLFILMEALAKMGLIEWIGKQTQIIIMSVGQESRLAVAILLILWVSAIASAFLDNIPLTTMMVKVVTVLASNSELKLPLQPLVWALSFGACFGGNGTLIGSSSNIICAGVAEQHGYKLTFLQYMKIGFPIMVISIVVVTIYLMLAHVVFQWH